MCITVTFLIFSSQLIFGIVCYYTCVPNTLFYQNGQACRCDSLGRWTEQQCYSENRKLCRPGRVLWHGCTQCICQENGQLICTNTDCEDTTTNAPNLRSNASSLSSAIGPSCTPYRHYSIDCQRCICPVTGRSLQANCTPEVSCQVDEFYTLDVFRVQYSTGLKFACVPKVMYLFNCYNCICPDKMYLDPKYCTNKCVLPSKKLQPCTPKKLYKVDCNVCYCPEDGLRDDKYCTHYICVETKPTSKSRSLRSKETKCKPNSFTKPKCLYCECGLDGSLKEKTCTKLDCLKPVEYHLLRKSCDPGDIIPMCVQCFCLKNSTISSTYCTKTCSYQIKVSILEKVLKDSVMFPELIDKSQIIPVVDDRCEPNSVYSDNDRYCLCPHDGFTNFNLCTSIIQDLNEELSAYLFKKKKYQVKIDFNIKCNPSTFVEFDCNTCYCNKSGRIDPDWCTYDDCEATEIVKKWRKNHNKADLEESSEKCIPGSLSIVDCNFCICPDSGKSRDKATCTKNECTGSLKPVTKENFYCDPLQYYLVDCNVCMCPQNGEKNVDKCTNTFCDTNFLRSDYCSPGQLFISECNVCVCPSNGDRQDKVCTNRTCVESSAWREIFKLSHRLLGIQLPEDTSRNLNLCFPGEEFVEGCNLCLCPDIGLRDFASCDDLRCDNELNGSFQRSAQNDNKIERETTASTVNVTPWGKSGRKSDDYTKCFSVKHVYGRHDCTPGSMYIIACKQCICPYMGNLANFCRPLPKGTYCEQPFPFEDYIPMGRRDSRITHKVGVNLQENVATPKQLKNETADKHSHTTYKCAENGKITDNCFICECEDNLTVLEHCFKNDAMECSNAKPTFLNKNDQIGTS